MTPSLVVKASDSSVLTTSAARTINARCSLGSLNRLARPRVNGQSDESFGTAYCTAFPGLHTVVTLMRQGLDTGASGLLTSDQARKWPATYTTLQRSPLEMFSGLHRYSRSNVLARRVLERPQNGSQTAVERCFGHNDGRNACVLHVQIR